MCNVTYCTFNQSMQLLKKEMRCDCTVEGSFPYRGNDVLSCRRGSEGMTSTKQPLVFTMGRLSSRQSLVTPNTDVW